MGMTYWDFIEALWRAFWPIWIVGLFGTGLVLKDLYNKLKRHEKRYRHPQA